MPTLAMPTVSSPPSRAMQARYAAFLALEAIRGGTYAEVAVDRVLRQHPTLTTVDRRLLAELVYGCTRQRRVLDEWIDRLATKPASQQPPPLRSILHLGLYQLLALDRVPASAAVHTSVELTKYCGFAGLSGFVNGLLRAYLRQAASPDPARDRDQSLAPAAATEGPAPSPAELLGAAYSYPAWIVEIWIDRLGPSEAEQLCQWFDRPPHLDLRVNPLLATVEQVEAAFLEAGIGIERVPLIPGALRLAATQRRSAGEALEHLIEAQDPEHPPKDPETGQSWIARLPGYREGWWAIQDASAQLAAYLLDPQPGEVVIDACAAPGGKTGHIAALMGDEGQVWAIDRAASRLDRIVETVQRLQLGSVRVVAADFTGEELPLPTRKRHRLAHWFQSKSPLEQVPQPCDRLLLDVPCSGLGTLHRRADARWRQSPESIRTLNELQAALLEQAQTWVKPGGVAVYATCTIHEPENAAIVRGFLERHPNWVIEPPPESSPLRAFTTEAGWLEVWPHRWDMDGFFMVRLRRQS